MGWFVDGWLTWVVAGWLFKKVGGWVGAHGNSASPEGGGSSSGFMVPTCRLRPVQCAALPSPASPAAGGVQGGAAEGPAGEGGGAGHQGGPHCPHCPRGPRCPRRAQSGGGPLPGVDRARRPRHQQLAGICAHLETDSSDRPETPKYV